MSTYPPPAAEGITPTMVQALAQTKPWVRFLSILGFVGTGFMVLAALMMLIMGAVGGRHSPFVGAQGIILGVLYLVFAVLYVPPSVLLFRYASAIAAIRDGGEVFGIERALLAQKSFWKYVGILALVVIGLYALFIVVAIVMGVLAASRRF